jgi:hypothetical protein
MEENEQTKVVDTKEDNFKIKKSAIWMMVSIVLAVFFVISILTHGFRGGIGGSSVAAISADDAADKAVTYINENLLTAGQTATLKSVEESNNLYNLKLDIGGREFDTYVTKDGELLFPSVVNMDTEITPPATDTQQQPPPAELTKSDKPKVELFVMSYCPYGTQAEKGIIPVFDLLGGKIDASVKFVNYAMHGQKEVDENLRQYCIETEQNDKYLPYLKCFLDAGDYASCLTENNIDTAKLDSCIENTDTEFKVQENVDNPTGTYPAFLIYDAENKQYGVRGSPTLVINGATVSSARSPSAFLSTICAAFSNPPVECEEQLSATNPSAGFGYSEPTAASNAAAAAQCT